jgi:predicted ATPase
MPLAIELAASRVRALSPEQILYRLYDRFRLLRGGRASDGRHKTLRTTIDWSHDLLSDKEKVLFRKLSVFSGGWTLPAAERVCAGGEIDEEEVLELLSGLVDKSLVMASQGGAANEARYRMLQTIRQYASEEIEGSGEAKAVGRRHAGYFVSLAEEAEPAMAGPDQVAWLERLEREHDNVRAALGWLGGSETRSGVRGWRRRCCASGGFGATSPRGGRNSKGCSTCTLRR